MSKLLIDEPPLQVLPSLAVKIGLNEAIALQQLHYWLINTNKDGERTAHFRNGRWWIYNSYKEWGRQFPFWSKATIQRVFLALEKKKLVISEQLDARERDMRNWYTIDYDALEYLSSVPDQITSNCGDASPHIEAMDDINLRPSIASDCGDASSQNEAIFHAETTSETTAETTHTQPPWKSGVWSKHSLEICRRYAQWLHDTKQGIKNPEGFARTCYQTGLDDKKIDEFLAMEESERVSDSASAARSPCGECGKQVDGPCSTDWLFCPLAPVPEEIAG